MRDLMLAALMPVVLICGYFVINCFGRFADKNLHLSRKLLRGRGISLSRAERAPDADDSEEVSDGSDSPAEPDNLRPMPRPGGNPGVIAYLPVSDDLTEEEEAVEDDPWE